MQPYPPSKPIAIFYATREGLTRKIAEHMAVNLCRQGLLACILDVREVPAPLELSSFLGAILAASVHLGRHEREMIRFVKQRRAELESLPTAFLSVTLSQAGVEGRNQTPEIRAQCAAGVQQVIDRFLSETRWKPGYVNPVAGALPYSKYNPLVRFVMKRIARAEGGDTDTSRDYEYTDWAALDHFVDTFVREILPASDAVST